MPGVCLCHKEIDRFPSSSTAPKSEILGGKTAETIAEYLHKGSPIWVRGRLQTRKYKDKNGADRWVTEVICEHFQFVQSAKDRAQQQQAEPARRSRVQEQAQTYDDGEVPF